MTGFDPVDLGQGYVGIQGSSIIDDCSTDIQWTAITGELFQAPISYTWTYSETGIGNWILLSNEEVLTISMMPSMPETFVLRLQVAGNAGSWGYATKIIRTEYCIDDDNDGTSFLSSDETNLDTENVLNRKAALEKIKDKEIVQIIIYDISGRQVKVVSKEMFSTFELKNYTDDNFVFIFKQYTDGTYDVKKMVNIR